jgi:hypothetical protein
MVKTKDIVVVGLDLSLNGPGFVAVQLQTDVAFRLKIINAGYVTQKNKKYGGVESLHALQAISSDVPAEVHVMKPRKLKTTKIEREPEGVFTGRRRQFTSYAITEFIDNVVNSIEFVHGIVVMENYAYSTKSTGQMELAEVAGLIKNFLWLNNIPLRLIDPLSVKMFATGHGSSKKIHMREAAKECGVVLDDILFEDVTAKYPFMFKDKYRTKDLAGPGTDIIDAFFLAQFGAFEVAVRRGELTLEQLLPCERKEFLKTTDKKPTNVLSRSYAARVNGGGWGKGDSVAGWIDG